MEPGLLQSAHWPLAIDVYFFLGGLAGGAFVVATIADLLDGVRYRNVVRVGYYIAFLAMLPGPLLLVLDLGLPTRSLHMLMVSKPAATIGEGAVTLGPFHFKPYSPMNMGAWALLGFGLCAFLTALDTFMVDRGGRTLGGLRKVAGLVGSVLAFFIAAYPGVLMGATARPLFIGGHWLGALFLAVGVSTGAAAIALILSLGGRGASDALSRLMRVVAFALVIEALALVLFVVSVWATGSTGIRQALGILLTGSYAPAFWVAVVGIGLVAPLALQFVGARRSRATPGMAALVSLLVLVGGFLVKYVLMAAGQAT
jgi:formate-dependent nitrite reductase membrane component NrfD